MENFTNNSIVRKINGCGHLFHINCIDTWLEENITCPVCRTDLREIENNEEIDINIEEDNIEEDNIEDEEEI